jgi:hypothetical protein
MKWKQEIRKNKTKVNEDGVKFEARRLQEDN